MNAWRGLGVIAALAAGVLALANLLWPQSQSSFALDVEPPEQALAAQAFEVEGVRGWLVRQRDGRVDAFWARSPHRGCAVELLEAGDPRLETAPRYSPASGADSSIRAATRAGCSAANVYSGRRRGASTGSRSRRVGRRC